MYYTTRRSNALAVSLYAKSHLTKRAVDGGDSARFTDSFLAADFSCSQVLSQAAPPPLTQIVGRRKVRTFCSFQSDSHPQRGSCPQWGVARGGVSAMGCIGYVHTPARVRAGCISWLAMGCRLRRRGSVRESGLA